MREQGIVRRWDAVRDFGFILGARNASVFFHIRDLRGSAPPTEGLRVSFEEIQVGGKGSRAMDVRPLIEAASRPGPTSAPARSDAQRATPQGRRAPHRPEPDAPTGAGLATGLTLVWLALLAWGAGSQRLPSWLLRALATLNLVTYGHLRRRQKRRPTRRLAHARAAPAPAGFDGQLARRLVGAAASGPQIKQARISARVPGHPRAELRGAGVRAGAARAAGQRAALNACL